MVSTALCPYYSDSLATLYHGDSREILPQLDAASFDSWILDPVWPFARVPLPGSDDPEGLFRDVIAHAPRLLVPGGRVAVHLGCLTDPRMLAHIPPSLPFLRVCWLPYPFPSRRGRMLYSGDVAYVFGTPPVWEKGRQLMAGEGPKAQPPRRRMTRHPTPRAAEHVGWLVRQVARGRVLDPFAGSGKTAVECKRSGLPSVSIEVCEAYAEETARTLEGVMALAAAPTGGRWARGSE